MVDFIITDFSNVRGGGNIVDTVPSAEDFIVDNCTISSSSSGVFVLTPGESLVGTVWLSANHTSITVGESVVFSATVEDTDGEPLEGLTVSFYRDGVSLGSGVSDDTGMVQLTVSSWSVGSFTCTASCQGVSSSGITVTVADVPPTPVVTSVSLTSDKSILSAYDSESAVLSATVLDGSSNPMSGETVTFYKGSTSIGTATTNSSGVATKSYSATGSGDVTFKATSSNIESSTLTVEDCIFYDPCTSNAKASAWTIPTGVTSQYSSDGWRISANAYKQIKLTEKLTSACSVEFTVVDYSTPSYSYPPIIVFAYTNGETTPNQQIFTSDGSSSMSILGNTINHVPVKGGKYKIDYTSSNIRVYENNTLLASASNSVGLPTRFEWHTSSGRWVIYKDLKVKPIQ